MRTSGKVKVWIAAVSITFGAVTAAEAQAVLFNRGDSNADGQVDLSFDAAGHVWQIRQR